MDGPNGRAADLSRCTRTAESELQSSVMLHSLVWLILLASCTETPIDFDTEIVPILTRSGCNAGACHGAAAGRGGFHLSLLGGDPNADFDAIVLQLEARRIHFADPNQSLLIQKPTMKLDHEGGDALSEAGARRIRQWIAEGANRSKSRELRSLSIKPSEQVVNSLETEIPIRVTAEFSNGTIEDVTPWTMFVSSDPAAVSFDGETHAAKVHTRGQHTLIARFLDRVVPIRIVVPFSDRPVDLSNEPRHNFIDDYVLRTLSDLRLGVAHRANDSTFLRRVTLDLTGRLPRVEEAEAFEADTSSGKRASLVQRLLDSDAFVDYWTYRFAKLFRVLPQPNDRKGAEIYHAWIRQRIADRSPFDRVAKELLLSTGDSHNVGAANFSRAAGDARAHAELVSQVFMGTRLKCANCHNHPLDRWTQDDYHGLAAVFARLERGQVVKLSNRGAVTNLRTGDPAIPRIPGEMFLMNIADPRQNFADWLTAPNNPYFSKAFVNRIWRGMFGRGLVEPTDDVRDTNPASHPELLDRLATDFVDHHFDLRHTLQLIALSETYARDSSSNSMEFSDERFYSTSLRRPLEPEVLADAICDATGIAEEYGTEAKGTRAISLFDVLTPSESLDVLGRCSRRESCDGVVTSSALKTKLHLINGSLINHKVTANEGFLHLELANNKGNEEIIKNMYLRSLSRRPSETESNHWLSQLALVGEAGRIRLLEDIFWGLLNCSEFALNH